MHVTNPDAIGTDIMTIFDKREQSFEAKFMHDEELRFKARQDATKCWATGLPGSSA
jgi:hypothetical protein